MSHVVVTGASSGIGEALAREFAQAGSQVTLVARRRELLDKLAAELGSRVRVVIADLADPEKATEWLAEAEKAFGPVDVLINNAGVQIVGPTIAGDPAEGERLLRLNVHTPLRLTRAVLPGMLARKQGTIVDIASLAALAPTPGMLYYNASKAALAAASESLRGELRGSGVHVVTVYPGPVDTPMARTAYSKFVATMALRLVPQGTTDVLARMIRKAVEKRRDRIIYPRSYTLARMFPGMSRWLVDRTTPAFQEQPKLPGAGGDATRS
jgi:short-subunit dehydrogenase